MIKIYLITFNSVTYQNSKIQQFITTNSNIVAYWNYIPYVYCVKSKLGSIALRDLLDPIFPQGGFIVAELNTGNLDGRLQPDAWPWFYDNQSELAPIATNPFEVPTRSLFGTLSPAPPTQTPLMRLGKGLLGPTKKK